MMASVFQALVNSEVEGLEALLHNFNASRCICACTFELVAKAAHVFRENEARIRPICGAQNATMKRFACSPRCSPRQLPLLLLATFSEDTVLQEKLAINTSTCTSWRVKERPEIASNSCGLRKSPQSLMKKSGLQNSRINAPFHSDRSQLNTCLQATAVPHREFSTDTSACMQTRGALESTLTMLRGQSQMS